MSAFVFRSLRPLHARIAWLSLSLTGLLVGATGCTHPPFYDSAHVGPHFVPVNYTGDAKLPETLRRVLLLPLFGGDVAPPESVVALDTVFSRELNRQNRFEVVSLSRAESQRRFRVPELSSTAALPPDFLATLKRDFAIDAVMFVDVTAFRPYRPLALGIRAKLVSADDVRYVWTFDTVFAADHPAIANAARQYALSSNRGEVPADLTPAILQSPSQFAGYAASATFKTLPAR